MVIVPGLSASRRDLGNFKPIMIDLRKIPQTIIIVYSSKYLELTCY